MITTLGAREAGALAHALVAHIARDAGVRALSVKGPILEMQGLRSPYVSSDADVLVDPAHAGVVVDALRARGWRERLTQATPRILPQHSTTLVHDEWPCDIDLHHAFLGFLGDDSAVFEELWRRRVPLSLAGTPLYGTDPIANSAMLALHCLRTPEDPRSRRELAGLVQEWNSGRADLVVSELLALAESTDAGETLRPFFTRLDIHDSPTSRSTHRFADWMLHVSVVHDGRTAAWLTELSTVPWRRRPRVLLDALIPPSAAFRAEHPEVGPARSDLTRARLRRLVNGARTSPAAIRHLCARRRRTGL